jgi:hypothetical protein
MARNPFRSEGEMFKLLGVVFGAAIVIVVGAAITTWLGVAFAIVAVAGVVWWLMQEPTPGAADPAPRLESATPDGMHRVLVVAPPGASSVSVPDEATDVVVVVPALVSTTEAITGAVDDKRAAAEQTALSLTRTLSRDGRNVRGEVGADDPVQAVEDALRTFGADEVVVAGDDAAVESIPGARRGARLPTALGQSRVEAVAHLGDLDAEEGVGLAAAVGRPALALVEAPRARVVVEHPEDRDRVGRQQRLPRDRHQRRAGAAPPRLRQHVDGVELPLGRAGLVARDAVADEADHPPVRLGDPDAALLAQELLPALDPPRQLLVEDGEPLGAEDVVVRRLPRPHVHRRDRRGVLRTRGPHVHRAYLPALSATYFATAPICSSLSLPLNAGMTPPPTST